MDSCHSFDGDFRKQANTQWIILYICSTAIGFRDGEQSFCTFSIQACLIFSAALAVRVKEEGFFCVYQRPSAHCNSLSMNRYQCPEMLKHLKSADLFNVFEIRNGLPGFKDQTNTI